jgi:Nucleoside 2-deoxyribosyltransferase like
MPATVHKAPARTPAAINTPTVFLSGTIGKGTASDWRTEVVTALTATRFPITIFNPCRDDWDSSWKEDISDPQFKEQVDWEMDHLARADLIAMFLAPDSISPITLLELGQHAASGKLIVCCPDGFRRKGYVRMVCARNAIPLVETQQELVRHVERGVERLLGLDAPVFECSE